MTAKQTPGCAPVCTWWYKND